MCYLKLVGHIANYLGIVVSVFIKYYLGYIGEGMEVELNKGQELAYWLSLGSFPNINSGR